MFPPWERRVDPFATNSGAWRTRLSKNFREDISAYQECVAETVQRHGGMGPAGYRGMGHRDVIAVVQVLDRRPGPGHLHSIGRSGRTVASYSTKTARPLTAISDTEID
jgi:hypothetical protein